MNPDEIETRLRRMRPAEPPEDLMSRLRAVPLPVRPATKPGWRRWLDPLSGWVRPWPLAYTGLAAVWMAILVLRLMTLPLVPASVDPSPAIARTETDARESSQSATFGGNNPMNRAFLFTRDDSAEFWP